MCPVHDSDVPDCFVRHCRDAMHPSWASALSTHDALITELATRLCQSEAQGVRVAPRPSNIFRALSQPIEFTSVLILGQDPYPTEGDAVGLSFSVSPTTPLPRSLTNIYKELVADVGGDYPTSGDLSEWSEQGVMLLNTVLSVEVGNANSHQRWGWQQVTQDVVRILNDRGLPLVAVLWGRSAQSLSSLLQQTPIVASAHPSPLSASRGFFGSRPFSAVNALLIEQGAQPIEWAKITSPAAMPDPQPSSYQAMLL